MMMLHSPRHLCAATRSGIRRLLLSSSSSSSSSSAKLPPSVDAPSSSALRILAARTAIPMVGFGFMDNIVMIQAGEAIDMSLGVAFGLSTLTAAGFGQCVSDVAGFTCGGIVDAGVARMNLPHHQLSPVQLNLKISRIYSTVGGCIGVVTGCLLGMSCLLFMDTDRADRAKKAKELQSIFETVISDGNRLVNAERATLWMLDETQQKLWSRVATGTNGIIYAPLKGSLAGHCALKGELINVADAYEDPRFNPLVDQKLGFHTKSVLCWPVRDHNGSTIGAIQMINKRNDDGSQGVFTDSDIKLVQMLSSHVACFIKVVNGED